MSDFTITLLVLLKWLSCYFYDNVCIFLEVSTYLIHLTRTGRPETM